jgi:hypothetical protein
MSGRDHLFPRHRHRVKERLHRRFAEAPAALMWAYRGWMSHRCRPGTRPPLVDLIPDTNVSDDLSPSGRRHHFQCHTDFGADA